ncbi:MAG: lysozyme inhibitor LprI family protein [Candidatus Binataceae bacterium]
MDAAAKYLATLRRERERKALVSGGPLLPTFDCLAARRAVEKAICSDPDLIRLDRQIDDAYKAALNQLDREDIAHLRREQRAFIARRDRSFDRPAYQLKREMEKRLFVLREKAAN